MKTNVIKESGRGYETLGMTDVLLQNREIFLTEEVNCETCAELIKQLLFLEREGKGEEIKLYINSPGGDVHSGLAVYDCMRLISSPITTICIGDSASMGAILFLAGDKRLMLPNVRIMIHDPSFSVGNVAGKKPHQIKAVLDKLIESQKSLSAIIAERTGQSLKKVCEVTKEDSYFNSEEAIKFGLATAVITEL